MKILKDNFKLIIGFILGAILAGGIAVYAAVNASDISYTRTGTNIKNVAEALNDLYSNRFTVVTGTNNSTNGIESIEVLHDNEHAMIFTGQASLEYSINSTDSFSGVTAMGTNGNGMGFYYVSDLSVKAGDTIYIKRNTNGVFGYAIVY